MLVKPTFPDIFQILRDKSVQNFIFLLLIQSSNVLISLVSMPLLIQALGVDQFGLVNLALSVLFLANVWVTFGYNLSGPREIAINQKNPAQLSAVASKVLWSKVLLAVFAGLVIVILIFGFGFFKAYKEILFFSLLLLFSEATASAWLFQGLEKMKMASVANVVSKLMYLLALILFIARPEDAKWVNFFLGGTALGANLLLLLYVHYQLKVKLFLPPMSEAIQSIKENTALFFSGLASHFSVHGGLIVLSFFASAAILGMFSLAERISMVLRMIPTLITQAVYPNASKLYHDDLTAFYRFLRKSCWGALGFSFIITILVFVLAPYIVRMLSGDRLPSSVMFLRILAFVPFLAALNIANMVVILVSDQKKTLFKSTFILAVYMVSAATVLSYFFGGEGLAYALVSTELITFAVCSMLIYQKTPDIFNGFYRSAFSSHYSC